MVILVRSQHFKITRSLQLLSVSGVRQSVRMKTSGKQKANESTTHRTSIFSFYSATTTIIVPILANSPHLKRTRSTHLSLRHI